MEFDAIFMHKWKGRASTQSANNLYAYLTAKNISLLYTIIYELSLTKLMACYNAESLSLSLSHNEKVLRALSLCLVVCFKQSKHWIHH
jgi:hypothetical protein